MRSHSTIRLSASCRFVALSAISSSNLTLRARRASHIGRCFVVTAKLAQETQTLSVLRAGLGPLSLPKQAEVSTR